MSHPPGWDPAAIERLERLGGPKLALGILEFFIATTPERIASILAATGSGELRGVAQTAHSLRSSAGNVGASEIAELAGRIEQGACADQPDGLHAVAGTLETCWKDLEGHVAAIQARLAVDLRNLATSPADV